VSWRAKGAAEKKEPQKLEDRAEKSTHCIHRIQGLSIFMKSEIEIKDRNVLSAMSV